MWRMRSALLVAPVTGLLFHGDWLLAGEGPVLHVYDKNTQRHLWQGDILGAENIKGIKTRCDDRDDVVLLAVHGGKTCSVISLSMQTPGTMKKLATRHFSDWIWDVAWLQEKHGESHLAVALAHNWVWDWDWSRDGIVSKSGCADQCILYTATLLGTSWGHLVVAGGTVFNQVVLWAAAGSGDPDVRQPVLHRLHGHQGVIFSVAYHSETQRLCSVSDDRSLRLWQVVSADRSVTLATSESWATASFHLLHVLYGHTARVWDARFLGNDLVSIGEDAVCCVWNEEGQVIRKFKGHRGKSIWSLAVDHTNATIATGGGDTSVRLWKLGVETTQGTNTSMTLTPPKHMIDGSHFNPKIVKLLEPGKVLVMTDTGILYCCHIASGEWTVLMEDTTYTSYSILAPSPDGTVIAVGNITGHIKLITEGGHHEQTCYDGKVFNLVWLDNGSLLSTGPDGDMVIWHLAENGSLRCLEARHRLNLPAAKQRWAAAAIQLADHDLLVCGDRAGSVHLYDLKSEIMEPIQSFWKVHGKAGVTDVRYHGDEVYTAGRDGQYRCYTVDGTRLELLHGSKVLKGFEWMAKLMFSDNDLYILGFHTNHFIVYSLQTNEKLVSIPCGGGHRAWDFSLDNTQAVFTYVKGGQVTLCEARLPSQQGIVKPSLHGREMCALCHLSLHDTPTGRVAICATGSEDTTINIVAIHSTASQEGVPLQHHHQVLASLRGHVSSIRALATAPSSSESSSLLFSGGGRAELMCWRISTGVQGLCMPPGSPAPSGPAAGDVTHVDYGRRTNVSPEEDVGEGHVGEGRVGEGHVAEGHVSESHVGEGHVGEGHVGEGHVGEGHVGKGHVGEGHVGESHVGEGVVGASSGKVSSQDTKTRSLVDRGCGTPTETPAVSCQYKHLATHRLHLKGKRVRKSWRQVTADPSPETRCMALTAFRITADLGVQGSLQFVAAACSDGYVRLFSFSEDHLTFDLVWECSYFQHCVLTVAHYIMDGRVLVVSGTTDGKVAFWDVSDMIRRRMHHSRDKEPSIETVQTPANELTEPDHVIQAHQSGINALQLRKLYDGHVALVTGGDDNSLVAHLLQLAHTGPKVNIQVISSHKHLTAHAAQVTGVFILDDTTVLSVSIDQRLITWDITYHPTLEMKQRQGMMLAVADVAQLACWPAGVGEVQVVVCGVGLQFLTLTKS